MRGSAILIRLSYEIAAGLNGCGWIGVAWVDLVCTDLEKIFNLTFQSERSPH